MRGQARSLSSIETDENELAARSLERRKMLEGAVVFKKRASKQKDAAAQLSQEIASSIEKAASATSEVNLADQVTPYRPIFQRELLSAPIAQGKKPTSVPISERPKAQEEEFADEGFDSSEVDWLSVSLKAQKQASKQPEPVVDQVSEIEYDAPSADQNPYADFEPPPSADQNPYADFEPPPSADQNPYADFEPPPSADQKP